MSSASPPLGESETKPLTDFIDELKTGELYVQVHTVQFDDPGAIRGQIQMGSVEMPRSIHLEGTGSSERDFSLPGQVLVGPAVVEIDGQPFDMISFATVLQSRAPAGQHDLRASDPHV